MVIETGPTAEVVAEPAHEEGPPAEVVAEPLSAAPPPEAPPSVTETELRIVLDPAESVTSLVSGSFETALTPWVAEGTNAIGSVVVAADARDGIQVARVSKSATGAGSFIGLNLPIASSIPVAQGESYVMGAYFKSAPAATRSIELRVEYLNTSNLVLSTFTTEELASGGWQRLTKLCVAPNGAVKARLYARLKRASGDIPNGATFDVDRIGFAAYNRVELDITPWVGMDVDWGDALIDAYMAEMTHGQTPVDYRIPNRTIVIPLLLRDLGGTSFATIRSRIQAKAGLFQREGGRLKRVSVTGEVFADIQNATLTLGGVGYFEGQGIDVAATLTLECLPDWYGVEIHAGTTVETVSPEIKIAIPGVKGDFPARTRIVVNELSGVNQLGIVWGLRSRNHSATSTSQLAYDAEVLTPLDTATVQPLAGASGGNVVHHPSLAGSGAWSPLLSTRIAATGDHLTHQGSYHVWARGHGSKAGIRVKLLWDVGDLVAPGENAAVTLPGASGFYPLDLGEVRLDPSPTSTAHRWLGSIQASGVTGAETFSVDRIWLVPTDDGYGVLRPAPNSSSIGLSSAVARDDFNQTPGPLTGKALAVGGTWTAAGSSGDWTVGDAGVPWITRSVATPSAPRFAIAGGAVLTSTVVQCDFQCAFGVNNMTGVFARYNQAANSSLQWFMFYPPSGPPILTLRKVLNGVNSGDLVIAHALPTGTTSVILRLIVFSDGRWEAWRALPSGALLLVAAGHDPAFAAGGALASGSTGIVDWANSTAARHADTFSVWVPEFDAVLYASRSAELRTDGMFRADSTGVSFGRVANTIGSLPRLSPAGFEGRTSELFLKTSRGDFGTMPDSGIDDVTVDVLYNPCWLSVPEE